MRDRMAMDAVLWNLIVIDEVCNRLGKEFHAEHSEIPWADVIGMRNILAHGCDIIDWETIGPTIVRDLPTLLAEARRILDTIGPAPEN